MSKKRTSRTFPLRVDKNWLDRIDDYRTTRESKHTFILKAVDEKINRMEAEGKKNDK